MTYNVFGGTLNPTLLLLLLRSVLVAMAIECADVIIWHLEWRHTGRGRKTDGADRCESIAVCSGVQGGASCAFAALAAVVSNHIVITAVGGVTRSTSNQRNNSCCNMMLAPCTVPVYTWVIISRWFLILPYTIHDKMPHTQLQCCIPVNINTRQINCSHQRTSNIANDLAQRRQSVFLNEQERLNSTDRPPQRCKAVAYRNEWINEWFHYRVIKNWLLPV